MSTIVAIATAPGDGAINIIRISGAAATTVADALFSCKAVKSLRSAAAQRLYLGKVHAAGLTDDCLAACFFAPKSYTGEDVVELQCHGGGVIAKAVVKAAVAAGALPAGRGEFTKRAFLNGKLSLDAAEAIADIIAADSAALAKAASRQSGGQLATAAREISTRLLGALAHLEASLDYPDEMPDSAETARKQTEAALPALKKLRDSYTTGGKTLKHGVYVAIVGAPNAGKSSLLNALLGEQKAIVTPIAGTTRDIVEGKLVLSGVTVTLQDTAGIRETCDEVENIGVQRAKDAAKDADITVCVTEYGKKPSFNAENAITVTTKCDLGRDRITHGYNVSVITGEGLDGLSKELERRVERLIPTQSELIITNERHFNALSTAITALSACIAAQEPELMAEDIRTAYNALGEITGETASMKIIDEIFSKFCLGK